MAQLLASMRSEQPRREWWLLAVLLAAVLLRLTFLTQHDLMDDEALLSFRGIGYFDTWFGSMKSPVELFNVEPWWQKLSFHDHPPFAFLVQHLSFRLLGITVWAARLPFALAGIATVAVMYVLGRALGGRTYGLLAAALLAVANYHVWISRVAFIESLLLLLVVTTLLLLVRSLDDARYLPWLGLTVGLSLITKYSALVLVPVVAVVLWRFRPRAFRLPAWWQGVGLGLLAISPVVVYNLMLFSSRGHFDATLWSMLGQRHADFGTDDHPYPASLGAALAWLRWLPQGFDLLTLALAAAGVLTLALGRVRDRRRFLILAYTIATIVFLTLSPGRKQYVALLIPAVALLGALGLAQLHARLPKWTGSALVAGMLLMIGAVTANSQLALRPWGWVGASSLSLRPTSFAYAKLDDYLDRRYAGEPLVKIPLKYQQYSVKQQRDFLAKIAAGARAGAGEDTPPFVIWDNRFDYAAARWTFLRRSFYLHQPMILTEEANQFMQRWGPNRLSQEGFRRIVFVFPEPKLLASSSVGGDDEAGVVYRQLLDQRGAQPLIIRDRLGDPAFAVYETSTLQFLYRREEEATPGS